MNEPTGTSVRLYADRDLGAQRQGVGTRLLSGARALSAEELRLFTFQRNGAARTFYAKHGFAPVAFGTSPAPDSEPDVELRWVADSARSDSPHPGRRPPDA